MQSDIQFWFAHISAPWYRTEMFLYFRRSYGSNFWNEICPSNLACLQSEKLSEIGGALFINDKNDHFFKTSFSIFFIHFLTLNHKIKSEKKIILQAGGPKIEDLRIIYIIIFFLFFYHPLVITCNNSNTNLWDLKKCCESNQKNFSCTKMLTIRPKMSFV